MASGMPARWNSSGVRVIYTSASRSLACLENVVHRGSTDLRSPFVLMTITIPDDLPIKEVSIEQLQEDWNRSGEAAYLLCRPFGDGWYKRADSAVLKVPSAIIPEESNYLLNQDHLDFTKISIKPAESFIFNGRIKK